MSMLVWMSAQGAALVKRYMRWLALGFAMIMVRLTSGSIACHVSVTLLCIATSHTLLHSGFPRVIAASQLRVGCRVARWTREPLTTMGSTLSESHVLLHAVASILLLSQVSTWQYLHLPPLLLPKSQFQQATSARFNNILRAQAVFRAVQLRNSYALPRLPVFGMAVTLAAGTALHLLIADNVELHGLGDGTSFLICLSIVSGARGVLLRSLRSGREFVAYRHA